MFEELIFMFEFVIISALSSYLLLRFAPEPLYTVIKCSAVIGIIIHELTHVLMCKITNTPIKQIILLEKINRIGKKKGEFNYGRKVLVDDISRLTFLQALLISLAPIYVSFWLFFFLLQQLSNRSLDVLWFYIAIFIMISIFLAAAPSFADLLVIPQAFNNNSTHSLYQIFILFISFGIIWTISTVGHVVYFHEVIFYGLVFVAYYVFKYFFRGVKGIFKLIQKKTQQRRSLLYRFPVLEPKMASESTKDREPKKHLKLYKG
jgi:hypothetical protein